jgi:hypothetical protein
MISFPRRLVLLALALVGSVVTAARAQTHITTPKEAFGANFGDDYFPANYKQISDYWHKLAGESNRIVLHEMGKPPEGRTQLMAIVTSPENHKKLARYKEISARLAHAEGLTDAQARALAQEGEAVVWIDGGLHASEVLGAQQLIELTYQLASGTDDETIRLLRDDIVLAVLVNPDGMDLVSDWYNRSSDPLQRSTGQLPVLYNHYAGHDDNRDFYMAALAESTNINKVMYREWFPQIMYNHHQTGPAGTVMFAPPFRDPFNYFFHPGAVTGIDVVSAMMENRFVMEGKPGVTQRKGAPYSTWFNGGIRTTAHFHNMIGILTETIGSPTPTSIPFLPAKQIGDSNLYYPIAPQQVWHFRQSIEYSMTANRAILDYASKYRETSLFNMYTMARDEIKWGSEDHWTFTPHEMERVQKSSAASGNALYAAMTSKELRDPRGWIVPSDQSDFGTATKFINALIKAGVVVDRATAPFTVAGKSYPANSYVVKAAQSFRPHVMDMFEPQDHPDDIAYPGAAPTPPYDATGYTLAFQMGVKFDRVLDGFDGPFQKIDGFAKVPAGKVWTLTTPSTPSTVASGYVFSHKANDSFTVVARLLKAGEEVSWLDQGKFGEGTFFVKSKPSTLALLQKAATDFGVTFEQGGEGPGRSLKLPRIGLYDQYGGNMPTGWTRLILENFEYPYTSVFPQQLDAGNLISKFDVLVFNGIGTPSGRGAGTGAFGGAAAASAGNQNPAGAGAANAGAAGGTQGRGGRGGRGGNAPPIPAEYQSQTGNFTAQTMEKVKEFVAAGGTVIYIGESAMGGLRAFSDVFVNQVEGLPQAKYYIPGSVLRVKVDPSEPLAHGLDGYLDVFFNNDPVFKVKTPIANMRRVAWFDSKTPLRSGWAWGQEALDQGIAVVDYSPSPQGHVYAFGPEILFRSQPHGNYKLFFNGLLLSASKR